MGVAMCEGGRRTLVLRAYASARGGGSNAEKPHSKVSHDSAGGVGPGQSQPPTRKMRVGCVSEQGETKSGFPASGARRGEGGQPRARFTASRRSSRFTGLKRVSTAPRSEAWSRPSLLTPEIAMMRAPGSDCLIS